MKNRTTNDTSDLLSIQYGKNTKGVQDVFLQTEEGTITCKLHLSLGIKNAVIWLGGAGGGLDGPARGMYPRLAESILKDRIASLRLHYRYPNNLKECVIDVLLGIEFLKSVGISKVILAGHSFGGAVVISAGAISDDVVSVIAMSSQTMGTDLVSRLSPKPLYLLHGTSDEILSDECSRELYRRASEPKEMKLYPGCRHGLDQCMDEVDKDVMNWIKKFF